MNAKYLLCQNPLHPRKAALQERQALKKSISSESLEELFSPEKSRSREKFTFTKCILESVIFGEKFGQVLVFNDIQRRQSGPVGAIRQTLSMRTTIM